MFAIFALVCTRSVRMPAAAPVMETARPPSAFTAIATSALAPSSPVASKRSSSRGAGCGETSPASLTKLSVTPAIADITATTRQPSLCVSKIRRATLQIRVGSPTDVPPYFWTIRRIGWCNRGSSCRGEALRRRILRRRLILQPTQLPLQILCLMKAGAARQTRLCDVVGFLSTAVDQLPDCFEGRRNWRGLRKLGGNDFRILQAVAGTRANDSDVFEDQIAAPGFR